MKAWTQLLEPGPALASICFLLVLSTNVNAAPSSTVSDQHTTEIEYYPVADATGCYYNFQHYDEGDRIITNEPCLNCTCHNKMLMCYLRVCPFTKAIGADCKVEKRSDQCCPVITCPEVPVQLVTSTVPSTALGHPNEYGCSISGLFYSDGARVPSSPNNPCELCYCIRNKTACVMQECTLKVDGCQPVYQEGACCPVRYNCEHPEYLEGPTTPLLTTTTSTTTTTTQAPTTTMLPQGCIYNGELYGDGALIKKDLPCEKCYCMRGDVVCAVQECGPTPLDKVNCTALPIKEGQCCPDTYDCASLNEEELTTISSYEGTTTALPILEEETKKPQEVEQRFKPETAQLPTTTEYAQKVTKEHEEFATSEQPTVTEQHDLAQQQTVTEQQSVTEQPGATTSKILVPSSTEEVPKEQPTEDFTLQSISQEEITELEAITTEQPQEEIKPIEYDKEKVKEESNTTKELLTTEGVASLEEITTKQPQKEGELIKKDQEQEKEKPEQQPTLSYTETTTAGILETITKGISQAIETITETMTGKPSEEKEESTDGDTEVETEQPLTELPEFSTQSSETQQGPKQEPATESEEVNEKQTESVFEDTEAPNTTETVFKKTEQSQPSTELTAISEQQSEVLQPTTVASEIDTQEKDENATKKPLSGAETKAPQTEIETQPESTTLSSGGPTDKLPEVPEPPIQSETTEVSEVVSIEASKPESVTEEEILPEKCKEQNCARPSADERKEDVTKKSESVTLTPQEEPEVTEKAGIETTTPEVVIVTEMPKKSETLEAMDHIAEKHPQDEQHKPTEHTLDTQTPEETASGTEKSEEKPTESLPAVISSEKQVDNGTDTKLPSVTESIPKTAENEKSELESQTSEQPTEQPEQPSYTTEETKVEKEEPVAITAEQPKTDEAITDKSLETHKEPDTTEDTDLAEQQTKLPENHIKLEISTETSAITTEEPRPEENEIETHESETTSPKVQLQSEEISKLPTVTAPTGEQNTVGHSVPEVQPQPAEGSEIPTATETIDEPATVSQTESPVPESQPETEKSVVPEVCTSETECTPVLPPTEGNTDKAPKEPVSETENPSEAKTAATQGTTETNKIPESETEKVADITESNAIPESSKDATAPSIVQVTSVTESGKEENSEETPTETFTAEEGSGGEPIEGSGAAVATELPAATEEHPASLVTETGKTQEEIITTKPPSREIPGEGSCLHNGKTYDNNSEVPPINRCHTSCKCFNSELKCETDCPPPPEGQRCTPIFASPESCCPEYNCVETTTIPQQEAETTIMALITSQEPVVANRKQQVETTAPQEELQPPKTPEESITITSEKEMEIKGENTEIPIIVEPMSHAAQPEILTETPESETKEPEIGTTEPSKVYLPVTTKTKEFENTEEPEASSEESDVESTEPVEVAIITKTPETGKQTEGVTEITAQYPETTVSPSSKPEEPLEKVDITTVQPELSSEMSLKEDTKPFETPATTPELVVRIPAQDGTTEQQEQITEQPQLPIEFSESEVPYKTEVPITKEPELPGIPGEGLEPIEPQGTDTTQQPEVFTELSVALTTESVMITEVESEKKHEVTKQPESEGMEVTKPSKEYGHTASEEEKEIEKSEIPSKEGEGMPKEDSTATPKESTESAEKHIIISDNTEQSEHNTASSEQKLTEETSFISVASEAEQTDQPIISETEQPEHTTPEEKLPGENKQPTSELPFVSEKDHSTSFYEVEVTDRTPSEEDQTTPPKEADQSTPAEEFTEEKDNVIPDEKEQIHQPTTVEKDQPDQSTPSLEKENVHTTQDDKEKNKRPHEEEREQSISPSAETTTTEMIYVTPSEDMRPIESDSHVTVSAPEEKPLLTYKPEEGTEKPIEGAQEMITKMPITRIDIQPEKEPTELERPIKQPVQAEDSQSTNIPGTESPKPTEEVSKDIVTSEQPSATQTPVESAHAEMTTTYLPSIKAEKAGQPNKQSKEKEPSESKSTTQPETELPPAKQQEDAESSERPEENTEQPAITSVITKVASEGPDTEHISTEKFEQDEQTKQPAEQFEERTKQPETEKHSEVEEGVPYTEQPTISEEPTEKNIEGTKLTQPAEKPLEVTEKASQDIDQLAVTELVSSKETQRPEQTNASENATENAESLTESGEVQFTEKPNDTTLSELPEKEIPAVTESGQESVTSESEESQPEEELTEPTKEQETPTTVRSHKIPAEFEGLNTTAPTERVTEVEQLSPETEQTIKKVKPTGQTAFTSPPETIATTTPLFERVNISLPDRIGEPYTSGPSEEFTTKQSIEGELSTSVPLSSESSTSILPATTSSYPSYAHIPGEPEMPGIYPTGGGEEEDYEEESPQAFGPGTCRYGGKVYVSAQQIPRDDPCDFCFCFRSDIICLQQSCPPPIPRCHEEPIRGFCCPRYECPVSMATSLNLTTSTTTTTTTLPPHFFSHAYKGRATKTGCQIQGKAYKVGEVIRSTSGPCLHCTCGGDGQMQCDPKACSPEPMLRQMIAAAASKRRR